MVNRKLQLQFLLTLLVGVLVVSFFILRPFLAPLALATVFAVILQPIYKRLLRYMGNRKAVVALLTVFLSVICVLIPLVFIASTIFNEAAQLYNSITQGNTNQNIIITVINSLGKTFENLLPGTGSFFTNLSSNLDMYIKQGLVWIIEHVGAVLSGISTVLLNLFIFFFSLYYLLRDGPKLRQALIKLSPLSDNDDTLIFDRLESAVNSFIKGSMLMALLQGILTAIGFTLFGIPNSVLWGTLTVIAALVPGVGTALVIVPGIIYLFITGSTLLALGLIVWGSLAVGLIDNVLGPKIIGHELQLPPLFVLLSLLGGLIFFGPVGIFLGPLTMSLLFALISTYSSLIIPLQEKN